MNIGVEGSHLAFGLLIFLVVSLMLVAVKPVYGQPTPTSVITPCDPNNLTGKWRANDGGTYFIRQIGSGVYSDIWWFGARSLQEGTPFSNVFHGQLGEFRGVTGVPDTVHGSWKDVPLGNNRGIGELQLSIDPSGQKLTKIWSRGDIFSGSEWIKNCRTLGDILKGPAK